VTREEFTGLYLGYIVKKIPLWLPEESTEEDMLETMEKMLKRHGDEIKKVLKLNSND